MPLINSVVRWATTRRSDEIEYYRKYPIEIQNETLFQLLQNAKDTVWGKAHNYESINSLEDFQKNIPLQDYNDIKPYVDRLRNGERDLLWPGETKWFAKSSGTTSDKSKFIPVTREALEDCHLRGPKDVFMQYIHNNPETKVLKGKVLTLGGSHKVNSFNNDSYYGDLSAIMLENVPFWSDLFRTPTTEIALIEEFEEKIEKIIETALDENVTGFAGVPSWYLVLFNKVLEKTGKSNLLDVWPNLEVFAHGGVNFDPYREQYKRIIPSTQMHYLETYNASEGFFGIQDNEHRDDMLLMLDYGIFYEFIPMSEFGKENPKVIGLEEVELHENYALVISTNAGLWRYIIGDTIKFTCKYPFKIKVTGRTKHFINAFGEEIIIDNAENAMTVACQHTGAIVNEYTAGPVFMDENSRGAHQWIIEFEVPPKDMDHFTSILDNTLKTLNSDYEAKRHKNLTLEFPHVVSAPQGTFYNWMKQRGKIGGQNKIPRLANNRQYLDELMNMLPDKS